ncbi:integral membrane protein [Fusarium circinatum]|uniref:Integral membrane protein n=1 Tax=Fusarium circinatum TaxID=48490 RepID=A0A8H5T7X5_FUSCI|nr:integral membrane protein [Fusarium circinatum]
MSQEKPADGHHQHQQQSSTGLEAMAALTDQVSRIKVELEHSTTVSPATSHAVPEGSPSCPQGRRIGYPVIWVHLKDTPGFFICEACYNNHITSSSLRSHFEAVEMTGDPPVSCSFWLPRIKNALWPEALQSNNIEKLCEFLNRLVEVRPCNDGAEVEYSVGAVVYRMSDNDIEGFIACESCYELYVAGTAFEGRFCRESLQGPVTTVCHIGYPYTRQSVARLAKLDDWGSFVVGAYERLVQQECTGTAVQADSREWLELPPGVADLFATCKTCYMDFLANEAFANEYISSVPPPGPNHQWSCALGQLSVKWALEAAVSQQNHAVFVEAVRTISGLQACTSAGITGGRWFTLVSDCSKFSICQGCYAGAIKSRGLDHYFAEISLQPEELQTPMLCSFCPSAPRYERLCQKLFEAYDTGNFNAFSAFAVKFCRVPLCPRIGALQDAKWWGYEGVLFCEECYYDFVSATTLGNDLPIKGVVYKEYQMCQIWSPRMRGIWKEVCEAGLPGSAESDSALEEFKTFAAERMSIYDQTIRQIEFLKQMQQIKNREAAFQGVLSIQDQGISAIASWGSRDHYKYGNNSIGWWDNRFGAEASRRLEAMSSGFREANNMSREMIGLRDIWETVE